MMKVTYETLTLGRSSNNPSTKDGKYSNANWLIVEHLCWSIVAISVWRWWINSLKPKYICHHNKDWQNYKKPCEVSCSPDRLHTKLRCLYMSNRIAARDTVFKNGMINIKIIITLKHYWQALYHWATARAVNASTIKTFMLKKWALNFKH